MSAETDSDSSGSEELAPPPLPELVLTDPGDPARLAECNTAVDRSSVVAAGVAAATAGAATVLSGPGIIASGAAAAEASYIAYEVSNFGGEVVCDYQYGPKYEPEPTSYPPHSDSLVSASPSLGIDNLNSIPNIDTKVASGTAPLSNDGSASVSSGGSESSGPSTSVE